MIVMYDNTVSKELLSLNLSIVLFEYSNISVKP